MIPGPSELLLILLIVIVIFGAKRIPEIMGGIGKGIRSFKKSMDEDEAPAPPPTPVAGAPKSPAAATEARQDKPAGQ